MSLIFLAPEEISKVHDKLDRGVKKNQRDVEDIRRKVSTKQSVEGKKNVEASHVQFADHLSNIYPSKLEVQEKQRDK